MKSVRFVLALCLVVPVVPVSAAMFDAVVPAASHIAFTVTEMGVPVRGGFRKFDARMKFDPARPAGAHAVVNVDLDSVDAGSGDANAAATGPLWFDVKNHRYARFVSTSIRPLGGGRYQATGTLTVKGRARTLSFPFTFTDHGGAGVFDGGFTINRADFAIGEGDWADFDTVANAVRVVFHIQAAAAVPEH